MTWKERSRVDERVLLIGEYMKSERSMTELCDEFGVSRKTAYKWLNRYKESGPAGLVDRSRASRSHPRRVDLPVREALVIAQGSPQLGWQKTAGVVGPAAT